MTRFFVIDSVGLGRAALDAAREDILPLGEPAPDAGPYDAVVADTCLTDEIWRGDAQPKAGSRVAEVRAPDFRTLAWRLAH